MNEAATILPNIKIYAIRLLPGEDLIKQLHQGAILKNINAGWIFSAVGSLTHSAIRFANQPEASKRTGHFEIISLSGIISNKGCHLHIMIADEKGEVSAGHVSEGCVIFTTAEIVIGYTDQYIFDRLDDGSTGWKELSINERPTE